MEPMLHTGDLVMAHPASGYAVGDVVFYRKYGGAVIHKVIQRLSGNRFVTQGVNNDHPDSWIVNRKDIAGKLAGHWPGAGLFMLVVTRRPGLMGLVAVAVVGLSFVQFRKPKQTAQLKRLLLDAEKESTAKRHGPLVMLHLFMFLVLLTITALVVLQLRQVQFWPRLALASGAVLLAVASALLYGNWVLNGKTLAEPLKSVFVLAPKLRRIDGMVQIDGRVFMVDSCIELRNLADTAKLPVLHQVLKDGKEHIFTLVTVEGNFVYRWRQDG